MAPRVTRPSLTFALAHEALYPRLESLCRQVEAIASRRPDAAVPPVTRAAAEALLFDALRFRPRQRSASSRAGRTPRPLMVSVSNHAGMGAAPHARELPPAPDTFAALATVLGQALATLDAFEARHSAWSAAHGGFVWQLARGEQRLVTRLRPKSLAPVLVTDDRHATARRAELLRRIAAQYDDGFEAGLRAAATNLSATTVSVPLPSPLEGEGAEGG